MAVLIIVVVFWAMAILSVLLPQIDKISIPKWVTPALLVSLCTFVVAIVGGFAKYLGSKPNLRVEVCRCAHSVRYIDPSKRSDIAGTEIAAEFSIINRGVRTSIDRVEIRCKPAGQHYRTTEKVQTRRAVTIGKGDTVPYSHNFYVPKRGIFETQLKCTFFLRHTYGKKKVKAKSNLYGERE